MHKTDTKHSVFFRWILNNKFTALLLNVLLILLIILIFTKVKFVFTPVGQFIGVIAPPIVLAAVLYYLMNPVVDFADRKWHVRRLVTIIILFVLLVGLIILGISLLIPMVQKQIQGLVESWPDYWQALQAWLVDISNRPEFISVKTQLNNSTDKIMSGLSSWFQKDFMSTFSNIGSAVSTVTSIVINVVTAPFILFFMLKDGDRFKTGVIKLAPTRLRPQTESMLTEINNAISLYIRGQLTVAFWVFVMFTGGYLIVGQKYAFVLGIVAGLCNLIPYVGSFIAMVPSVIIAAFTAPSMLIKVLIVFIIEQTIEGRVISPLVMGSKLEMHPVTTIIVLLTAGNLFGFLGVLLGIPGYAVLKIIVTRLWRWFKEMSGMYESAPPTPATETEPTATESETK